MEKEIRPNIKLKMFLFERDISQKKLALLTGIDPPWVSDAIRYGIVTPEMKKKISRALGVNEEEIFGGNGNG